MNALDTNVLVRFLVQDDEKQAQVVNQLLKDAETQQQTYYVSNVVVLELMWVLKAAYDVPRDAIVGAISELLSMVTLEFQDQTVVRDFTISAQNNTYDLSDLFIGQVAQHAKCETTLTFDKKAAKSTLFSKL
jgi:predicted nucleic-acid-binding protein